MKELRQFWAHLIHKIFKVKIKDEVAAQTEQEKQNPNNKETDHDYLTRVFSETKIYQQHLMLNHKK